MIFVFIFLILIFLKCLILHRVYHALPMSELKRRARGKDKNAHAIYKVAAHGGTFDLLVWLFGIAGAIGLIIITAGYAWWAAAATILIIGVLTFWGPRPQPGGKLWSFAGATAPTVFKLLNFLFPVLDPLAKLLPATASVHTHTGFYEKEDLLALLDSQNKQVDNRIPEEDLKMAAGALSFGDKKVESVMTPLRAVRFVGEDEAIGPMLMDELHATGFSRFPVVKSKNAAPNVTGTLYMKDLIEHEGQGRVRDEAKYKACFINETCTLHQALDAILKNQHHLLVVVNNFEETVGVITLEDIIEQILGYKIVDEFDKYDDMRAVAGLEAKKEHKNHNEQTVAPKEE